ncbi:MAG: ClbS/DfsB family four-helix bundle protein [Anaerolineales bacterium]|jgi:hypothetical protein|nr:ClbS/DfsB family four-helix bundle protein [Anaerolineales bacterium]
MNKQELLDQLENERERFLDAIEGLSDEDLQRPGVVGDWSVKDIMSHISRWEAELIKLLWQARQGQKPTSMHFTQVDVDATNLEWFKESHLRPLRMVLDDFQAVRNQTILRTEAFSEKDLADPKRFKWAKDRPLADWIASDSFEHEAEHREHILAWRKAQNI